MLSAVPYHTFPEFHVGPVPIHTFGLMVATGILVGIAIASRYAAGHGIAREEVVRFATRLIIFAVIGSRVSWDLTHLSQIRSPVDLVAVWQGGLQFTGGFVAAMIVAVPMLRRWEPAKRWVVADGSALGLAVGLAIGRIGCYSVGEHLGHTTNFFLGVKYLGGPTREGPLVVGQTYHNTALYEFVHLLGLVAILRWVLHRREGTTPGTGIGLFCLWYGVWRFSTDTLRAYDARFLHLTGAQWLCLVLVPTGVWILATTKRRRARLQELAHHDRMGVAHGEERTIGEPVAEAELEPRA